MSQHIDIRPQDLEIVNAILRALLPADARVWVFGSRAKSTTRRSSDLDLAVDAGRALSRQEQYALEDAFEESNVPYKVDCVDLHRISPEFLVIINKEKIPLLYLLEDKGI